ncbi:MAG: hypothetical protein BWY91_03204 [bacterium ADurb.BinA028]|nr:MAG: hypothetical protein BWY91_03204 [bacterium ADurb.BinA028]
MVEVGDQADDVREVPTGAEGGTPLVVDKHEAQLIGAIRGREPGHEADEQLRLARPRRPSDQRVGAVADEVDRQRPRGGGPDGSERRPRTLTPTGSEVGYAVSLGNLEDVQQGCARGNHALVRGRCRVAQRPQPLGEQEGPGPRDPIGFEASDRLLRPRQARGAGAQLDDLSAGARQVGSVGRHGQDVHVLSRCRGWGPVDKDHPATPTRVALRLGL